MEKNKEIVIRFNKEVIAQCNRESFELLMHKDFINRTAPANANTSEDMWHTFYHILRPAFADLKVEIYDQLTEGDKVTTRKAIVGKHTGTLMGIAPTGQQVKIDVIDIVRLQDEKYIEHWGINTLPSVLAALKNTP